MEHTKIQSSELTIIQFPFQSQITEKNEVDFKKGPVFGMIKKHVLNLFYPTNETSKVTCKERF